MNKVNWANVLTFYRILVSPLLLILFYISSNFLGYLIILIIVIFGELTDILDGYIARKTRNVSEFGKLMDPYSDSIFRLTIFFGFASKGWIPVWMPVVMLYRDIAVSILRTFALKHRIVIAARSAGKIKAIIQGTAMVTILILILFYYHDVSIIKHDIYIISLIATIITAYSGIEYLYNNKELLWQF